ncbi:hypothetical protein WMF38_39395 [Sorangium sp. So ce118]
MIFRFETRDVPVPTSRWVGERLGQKRGGWIFGPMGTGKSYAVRMAMREGIRVDVASGPLLSQRFASDLARQLGPEGRPFLEAFRSEGIEASLHIADRTVNGHPFVVDGADALLPGTPSLDDPAASLWQDEKQVLLDWLRGRLERSPTFLVGRRHPQGVESTWAHAAPGEWPIRLEQAGSGYRNWPTLGKLAKNNPAVLTLARALIPLLPASAFNDLVEQAKEDEATVLGLLQGLGEAFQSSAPPSWQRVLSLVGALGEVPRDAIEPLLDGRAGAAPAEPGLLAEERSTLDRLCGLKLVEERSGVLSLLPALVDAGAVRALTPKEREELLPAVAHALLAPVNDVRSLAPEQASRVLRAHALFVELGDMSRAEHTAALHVHGLVELARRTSLDERHAEAWRQYDGLLRMMQSGPWSTGDRFGRRLLSYVRHYRSRDGALAGMLDGATCLAEYRQAVAEWPDNALWHQRLIETLVRLGRPIEAMQAVNEASARVDPHPRRDELLRVRPAATALHAELPLLSLELIEPVLDAPVDLFPEVADGCRALLRRWENGLPVRELPFRAGRGDTEGRIVFHAPVAVDVRKVGGTWAARLRGLTKELHEAQPRASIEALACHIAHETRRLVSTPSSDLVSKDVRLKGRLLATVDVLNSDIGLDHVAERWIVGRVAGRELVPTMRHLPRIELPEALLPESAEGLYLARVPVHRDGAPSGPATSLEPAGSGRDVGSLIALLARMSGDAA